MTIAAGFRVQDGILLCADTLYTDGNTKQYGDKIFPWAEREATACFALAGSYSNGKMAIDDCRDALSSSVGRLTVSSMIRILRPVLLDVQKKYVHVAPANKRGNAEFNLLIALVTESEDPRLFITMDAAITEVHTFECIGIGHHIGHHVIDPIFEPNLTIDQAVVLALDAVSAAKQMADGVGGKAQLVAIRNKRLSTVFPHDANKAEPLILEYRRYVGRLLQAIADPTMPDDSFTEELRLFAERVTMVRKSWAEEPSWDDLVAWLKTQGQAGPLSTITDQLVPPPSRVLPEGSDES